MGRKKHPFVHISEFQALLGLATLLLGHLSIFQIQFCSNRHAEDLEVPCGGGYKEKSELKLEMGPGG